MQPRYSDGFIVKHTLQKYYMKSAVALNTLSVTYALPPDVIPDTAVFSSF